MPGDESELTNLACELSLLKSLSNHDYLIQYLNAFALDANATVPEPHMVPPAWKNLQRGSSSANRAPNFGFVGIITDLAREGSLEDMLQKCASKQLPEKHIPSWAFRLRIALELAEALHYLHGQDLLHRDVKPANVLFDHHFHVRLCDYGLAVGSHSEARLTFLGGTEQFMAPEMILADYGSEGYGPASDVFSFGLVLGALIGLKPTGVDGYLERSARSFFEVDFDELKKEANIPDPLPMIDLSNIDDMNEDELDDELPPPPPMSIGSKGCPQSFLELTIQCLAGSPDDRPSSEDIIDWLKAMCLELQDFDNIGFENSEMTKKRLSSSSSTSAAEVEVSPDDASTPIVQVLPLHRSPNSFEDAIYVLRRFIGKYRRRHDKIEGRSNDSDTAQVNNNSITNTDNNDSNVFGSSSSESVVQGLEGVNATALSSSAMEDDDTSNENNNNTSGSNPGSSGMITQYEDTATDDPCCLARVCYPPEDDGLLACLPDEFCGIS